MNALTDYVIPLRHQYNVTCLPGSWMDSGSSHQPRPCPSADDGRRARKVNADSSPSPAPVYWQHRRYESYASIGSNKPPPITLEDNTEDVPDVKSPLWAKHVSIDDHIIVTGRAGVGDYTVWNVQIDTLDVSIPSHGVFNS